ncbi:S-adenosyl-L-methionine-dependent methyltransferase [Pyronema omphalodes]|nr:S-adenosyl-L-methionine-dependent methyltransferase [Pyronema omphalodes]
MYRTSPNSTPMISMPTTALYDAWASTYDHDQNVLQQLDSQAFDSIIPSLISSLPTTPTILDLGAGTGRNTHRLLELLPPTAQVLAVDASQKMLALCKKRCERYSNIKYEVHDMSESVIALSGSVDAVISTLVLEHVQLKTFFSTVATVLRKGGWAWITDMSQGMGESVASFRDHEGIKRRGDSWNWGVEETVEEARRAGLELVDEVKELGVLEDVVERLGERSRKWVGRKMLVGFVMRRV